MIIGINACRARSGGARSHLIGIISQYSPSDTLFSLVHVWSYPELLDQIPNAPWLIKHSPKQLSKGLLLQLIWEFIRLPFELQSNGCDVVLNVDAGTVCPFLPSVTISRDMLAFEPGEDRRFGWSKERFRQIILKRIQCRSLRGSTGAVFLTKYASSIIEKSCGILRVKSVIPHGVGACFKRAQPRICYDLSSKPSIEILYVSPIWLFKHQWNVVKAIEIIRKSGLDVRLTLIGGSSKDGLLKLNNQLKMSDPNGNFVSYIGHIPHSKLPDYFNLADIFVFASSCENMPNSLIEAMSFGLPIACSDRGPMPEVLGDAGVYFNPENPENIAAAIKILIENDDLRNRCASHAHDKSSQYSWKRCAEETFRFAKRIATN